MSETRIVSITCPICGTGRIKTWEEYAKEIGEINLEMQKHGIHKPGVKCYELYTAWEAERQHDNHTTD